MKQMLKTSQNRNKSEIYCKKSIYCRRIITRHKQV